MNGNELRRLWPGNQSPASQGPGERVPGPGFTSPFTARDQAEPQVTWA